MVLWGVFNLWLWNHMWPFKPSEESLNNVAQNWYRTAVFLNLKAIKYVHFTRSLCIFLHFINRKTLVLQNLFFVMFLLFANGLLVFSPGFLHKFGTDCSRKFLTFLYCRVFSGSFSILCIVLLLEFNLFH